MAQDGVFNVGQSDLDADFMQDINDIAVEDFADSKVPPPPPLPSTPRPPKASRTQRSPFTSAEALQH